MQRQSQQQQPWITTHTPDRSTMATMTTYNTMASTTSTSSSISSLDQPPSSPIFSTHQPTRFSSANSSIASSPAIRSSIDGFCKNMPLSEVIEEKEKESTASLSRDQVVSTLIEDIANRDYLDATTAFPDYDWIDSPPYEASDYDFYVNKRRCADGYSTPTSMISARLTGRFPSIARKLKSKREKRSSSITGSMHDNSVSRSRASSLRAPSVFEKNDILASSFHEPCDLDLVMNVEEEEEEENLEDERVQAASRTPLLPPVLAVKQEIEEPIQSPLQSPSVDATASLPQSPYDSPNPYNHLPSPPLSTKPSVASFHHRSILPSAEIPIINLADTQDEWSIRLGHGNFTITPEPYQLQAPVTLAACQRLKADWELAKHNFALHLERTGQVYNETSKTYYLTKAKWNHVNAKWKSYHEQALGDIPRISQEALQASFHSQDATSTTIETLPPASPVIPLNEGKFPTPAAGGVVGPMEQAKPILPRTCRKRSFWRFLQGVWPSSAAWGISQA